MMPNGHGGAQKGRWGPEIKEIQREKQAQAPYHLAPPTKMCLSVYANGEGDGEGDGKGTHSLAEPDSHTKSGRESGDTRVLSWCYTVSKSVGD